MSTTTTNLPPRAAYQSRLENPGEKKSKADMSHSIISSSGGNHSSSVRALNSTPSVNNQYKNPAGGGNQYS